MSRAAHRQTNAGCAPPRPATGFGSKARFSSLRLVNFKNFVDETLRMGPFTVLVGANASGKSNIRDALRFLHGVGRGYRLADIIGGKYGAGGQVEWEAIRGAGAEIVRFGESRCSFQVELEQPDQPSLLYSITIGVNGDEAGAFKVVGEELRRDGQAIVYTSDPPGSDPVRLQNDESHLLLRMGKTGRQKKYGHRIGVRPDQPALSQIREHRRVVRRHKESAESMLAAFASMRFLDLSPRRMREPSFPGQTVLGARGENLPTVLRDICADADRAGSLARWTRELSPMDVEKFEFRSDATTGRLQLAFRERNGRVISAWAASDGTLRFLAMLAALLGGSSSGLYVFEEIDNGIHPARLRLLLDLIEGQTAKGKAQVVTTTHSPELLSIVQARTFEDTSVVCRRPDTEDAVVRRLSELPNARELRKKQGLARLHASGWMEDAILFSESSGADEGHPG